jgi:hypothetical protein
MIFTKSAKIKHRINNIQSSRAGFGSEAIELLDYVIAHGGLLLGNMKNLTCDYCLQENQNKDYGSAVYMLIFPSGMYYIGVTSVSVEDRVYNHLTQRNTNGKGKLPVSREIKRHDGNVLYLMLEEAPDTEMGNVLEAHLIDTFSNLKPGSMLNEQAGVVKRFNLNLYALALKLLNEKPLDDVNFFTGIPRLTLANLDLFECYHNRFTVKMEYEVQQPVKGRDGEFEYVYKKRPTVSLDKFVAYYKQLNKKQQSA